MKETACIILAMALLFTACAIAEEPGIVYTYCDGHTITGIADAPPGWYIRIVDQIGENAYLIRYHPIGDDGTFEIELYGERPMLAVVRCPWDDLDGWPAY